MTLIHRLYKSGGQQSTVVKLTSRNIFNSRASGTCFSGVRLGLDGRLYLQQAEGGFNGIVGEWLVNGTASTFYVSMILNSGTLNDNAGAGPLQLNANRDYNIQRSAPGIKTASITLTIADNATGLPIITGGQFNLECEQGNP